MTRLSPIFSVKFASAPRPRRFTIRPSNITQYTRDEDSELVERWMSSEASTGCSPWKAMRPLTNRGQRLSSCRGSPRALGTWRDHAADDLDAIAGLLPPTDRRAVRFPCPSPGSDGCPAGSSSMPTARSSPCAATAPRDATRSVCRAEVIVHALDPRRLCAAVAAALQLDDMFQVVDTCWQTWRVGDYVPLSGERFPVYLSIPDLPDWAHRVAVRLTGIADRPFLMLVPARAQVDPVTSELLSRTKSGILALENLVAVDDDGRWAGQRPAAELLREFRIGVLGEDGRSSRDPFSDASGRALGGGVDPVHH